MIRDPGPIYQMGFGATTRNQIQWNPDEQEGVNPNSGPISKALHGHPVMRFFAVGAATLLGAAVAGQLVRKGGIELGVRLSEHESPWIHEQVKTFRKVQGLLDSYEGVRRTLLDSERPWKLFERDPLSGKIQGDKTDRLRGYFFTREEGATAARYRSTGAGESLPEWKLRHEIQQRMVSSARRLPYELPAAYVTQRAISDKLLGVHDDKKNFHWYNPLDVISDFVTQSVKNTAFAIMPFEAAGASATHGWRRLMTLGDGQVNLSPFQQKAQGVAVSLKTILGQVGADAGDLYQKTARISSQVTGSFATGLNETQANSQSLVEYLYKTRRGLQKYWADESVKTLSRGQKALGGLVHWAHQDTPNLFDIGPGPFSGMGSGLKAARAEWIKIGEQQEAYQEMRRIGMGAFIKRHEETNPIKIEMVKSAIARTGSPVQELAEAIDVIAGGGPGKPGYRSSQFYKGQMQQEYTERLAKYLKTKGVPPKLVDQFFVAGNVKAPGTSTSLETEATKRVRFGRKTIYHEDTGEFASLLKKRMHFLSSQRDIDVFANELPEAMKYIDAQFQSDAFQKTLYRKISAQWNHFEKNELPDLASRIVKPVKADYHSFTGRLEGSEKDFLRRRSAQLAGIDTLSETGHPVDDAVLFRGMKERGLNPYDMGQLRAYLIDKGAMTKPWQTEGRNIFGFRPLLISEGLHKGFFNADPEVEANMRDLVDRIGKLNPQAAEAGFKLSGFYESTSGEAIDLARIGRGFRSFMDKFSTDFQIPLIHLKPGDPFNYRGIQALRTRSVLQYVPGRAAQPFLTGGEDNAESFYMWMRGNVRGSKGHVVGVGLDENSMLRSTRYPGMYRPFPAYGESIIPHHAQLAAGSLGQEAASPDDVKGGWLRRMLNPADDQSRSIFSYMRRFRDRAVDIKNPRIMARFLAGEEIESGGSVYNMADGQIMRDGEAFRSKADVADAFEGLQYSLRPYGFPTRALNTVLDSSDDYAGLLNYKFKDEPNTFTTDAEGKFDIRRLSTPSQIVEAAKKIFRQDNTEEGLTDEVQTLLRRARSSLIDRHLRAAGSEGYWETASGVSAKSGTIFTRADELKSDLEKYVLLKAQVAGGAEGQQYSGLINDLMSAAATLRGQQAMTQSEFTEFRTALLSLQVNVQSFKGYSPGATSLGDAQVVIESMMGLRAGQTGEALRSYGRGEVGVSKSRWGSAQPWFRRQFGIAPAEYEGMEYNTFGDTSTVFAPTFGTAYNRNPLSALASAAGIKTWNNPEGFSGASIPMSHFMERLNKPFSFLGMGLEPTAYHGPLDFYARGLVGQRMLPLVAGSAGLLAADRTLGGYTNPKDQYGHRQYKPVFTGALASGLVEGEAAVAGAVPGGMGYDEKLEQLRHGEVPIREGRFWPLGSTPFMGGRIQYYRPSWYQRFMSGYQYTDQTYGSPAERLAFDYDFSPLRPLDPYHFEREHYHDRPYPVTGEYFTGPWGPLNSVANATLGRVLKPQRMMHQDELNQGLGQYQPVGETGSYFGPALGQEGYGGSVGGVAPGGMGYGGGGGVRGAIGQGSAGAGVGGSFVSVPIAGGNSVSGAAAAGNLSSSNQRYAQAGAISLSTAAKKTAGTISGYNEYYANAANIANQGPSAYGIPTGTGMTPRIIPSGQPLSPGGLKMQGSDLGYKTQELLGIYGFLSSSLRTSMGFGNTNLVPPKPVLASASTAYGASRGFWDLNLGGTGDVPSPFEGNYANLEVSEILRRFIPKPRGEIQQVNPIPNDLGKMQSWLPGADYFTDFTRGDPFSKIPEGEMRLPGAGYETLHKLHPDQTGQYGILDKFKILGDVAPWSNEYHALDRQIDSLAQTPAARDLIETTRSQVAAKNVKHEFTPYKYKYQTPADMLDDPAKAALGRWWEGIEHRNTYLNQKFLPVRTATEDWERENVYGATFPEWSHPIKDFIKPMIYTNTQRNPIAGALVLGTVGTLFGATPRGKAIGGIFGAGIGAASGAFGETYKMTTGHKYIPEPRREQLALEEYTDILGYVRNMHMYQQAQSEGNPSAANAYRQAAQTTMYGADIYNGNLSQIAMAIPERKRDHFRAMLSAPEQERGQILSTAPRLERRIYEAAWGMPVEKRPDLNDYFQEHELPSPDWEGYDPSVNMDQVKVKIGQSMGIDMSEMGYYPQQIMEANAVNPAYPNFNQRSSGRDIGAELRMLLSRNGIDGHVQPIHTPYPGTRLEMHSGVN